MRCWKRPVSRKPPAGWPAWSTATARRRSVDDLHHRRAGVGVRQERKAARLEQLVMPPFIAIEVPAGGGHDAEQQGAVLLLVRRDVQRAVEGERREGVKPGAH